MLRSMAGSISIIRTRLVLLFMMLVVLGFVSFGDKYISPKSVSASPCHEVEHFYYDDQWHTNQVGYRWLTCWTVYSWGVQTQYELVVDGDYCPWC
jgi:hypothetical protein